VNEPEPPPRSTGIADGPRVAHLEGPAEAEACEYCGARALAWRKCKLICRSCAQVNRSCADL
jgi:hypothetical protein